MTINMTNQGSKDSYDSISFGIQFGGLNPIILLVSSVKGGRSSLQFGKLKLDTTGAFKYDELLRKVREIDYSAHFPFFWTSEIISTFIRGLIEISLPGGKFTFTDAEVSGSEPISPLMEKNLKEASNTRISPIKHNTITGTISPRGVSPPRRQKSKKTAEELEELDREESLLQAYEFAINNWVLIRFPISDEHFNRAFVPIDQLKDYETFHLLPFDKESESIFKQRNPQKHHGKLSPILTEMDKRDSERMRNILISTMNMNGYAAPEGSNAEILKAFQVNLPNFSLRHYFVDSESEIITHFERTTSFYEQRVTKVRKFLADTYTYKGRVLVEKLPLTRGAKHERKIIRFEDTFLLENLAYNVNEFTEEEKARIDSEEAKPVKVESDLDRRVKQLEIELESKRTQQTAIIGEPHPMIAKLPYRRLVEELAKKNLKFPIYITSSKMKDAREHFIKVFPEWNPDWTPDEESSAISEELLNDLLMMKPGEKLTSDEENMYKNYAIISDNKGNKSVVFRGVVSEYTRDGKYFLLPTKSIDIPLIKLSDAYAIRKDERDRSLKEAVDDDAYLPSPKLSPLKRGPAPNRSSPFKGDRPEPAKPAYAGLIEAKTQREASDLLDKINYTPPPRTMLGKLFKAFILAFPNGINLTKPDEERAKIIKAMKEVK